MCGITGYLELSLQRDADSHVVQAMCDRIVHRGPDDQGIHCDGPVGLGHRRLSIIDVGGGHQPLSNEDDSVWIAYNGEVYNFVELRDDLVAKGHSFKTQTDTEALVHAYEEYGIDFVSRLNGMFAFAIWDAPRRRLVLARDRMGQKPLYWAQFGDQFLFASELKALLAHPSVQREVDLASVSRYFALATVPAPHTIFRNIYKLPPACRMVVEDGDVRIDQYWEYPLGRESIDITVPEAEERLIELLRAAVQRRLVSDVPLGVFLSGGLDSSLITALMCQVCGDRVKSFSIGFDDSRFDESVFARTAAKYLKTDHHEQILAADTARDMVPEIASLLDEPLADDSIVPTYLVSKFARQHVTVALGGDGGDELTAGYPLYAAHQLLNRLEKFPGRTSIRMLDRLLTAMPSIVTRNKTCSQVKRLLRGAQHPTDTPARHYLWKKGMLPDQQQPIFTKEAWNAIGNESALDVAQQYWSSCPSENAVDKALFLDAKLFLQDDVLTKVDRASMAVSLEVRAPLLDHTVVEFLASLPLEFKLKGNTGKFLLKRVAERMLPHSIVHRRKQGFASPVSQWIREPFKELLMDLTAEDRLQRAGIFNATAARTIVQEHFNDTADHELILWRLLMFELWHEHYM